MVAVLDDAAREKVGRGLAITIPGEHGAWAMLTTSTLAGLLGASGLGRLHLPVLLTVLCLFLLQEPVRDLVRARRPSPLAQRSIAAYGAASLATVAWLIAWRAPLAGVIALGAVGAGGFAVELLLIANRRERTALGQLLAIALLSLPAAAGPLLARNASPRAAFALWVLCLGFLGGSVFSVKRLVRVRRWAAGAGSSRRLKANVAGLAWLAFSAASVLCLAALGWLPVLAPLALAPSIVRTVRTIAASSHTPNLTRIGVTELVYCSAFCALVAASYAVGR